MFKNTLCHFDEIQNERKKIEMEKWPRGKPACGLFSNISFTRTQILFFITFSFSFKNTNSH